MDELDARAPQRVFLGAAGLFGVLAAVVVALAVLGRIHGGLERVLLFRYGGDLVSGLLLLLLLVLFAAVSCLIRASGWSLLLAVLLRILSFAAAAVVALWLLLIGAAPATTIFQGDCPTGYAVQERSFLFLEIGRVYAVDGIWGVQAGRVGSDDGYQPFADGAYLVSRADGSLEISFGIHSADDRDGSITLPERLAACG